jgi:glycosyltransferase involved in cell wall biosynthesis
LDKEHYFKGVDFLINSWPDLNLESVKLLIVGQGDLREKYRKTAAHLGLADKVIFAERVSDEELPSYYNMADLLILPSINSSEAFGIVLIEAMACGVPTMASNLPGVRSVISNGQNGFLFKVKDSRGFLNKIRLILTDDNLKDKLRKGARDTAVSYYDQNKIWKRLEGTCSDLSRLKIDQGDKLA